MTYLTTVQAAAAANLSEQRIRVLCAEGRITGAMKIGKAWLIPAKFKIRPAPRHRIEMTFIPFSMPPEP